MLIRAMLLKSSCAMWSELPVPDEAKLSSPGRERASAISSFIDLTGSAGATTSTSGADAT